MAYDSLSSLLEELDDHGDLFLRPELTTGGPDCVEDWSPSSSSDVVLPPKTKRQRTLGPNASGASTHCEVKTRTSKARHNDRTDKLRSEIDTLYGQLKRLQQDAALRSESFNSSWKQRAICERFARERGEHDNACLRHRLAEGLEFRDELKKLLVKQQEMLPSRSVYFSLVDDDSRAFELLRADLFRRQCQLESSLQSQLSVITHQGRNNHALEAKDKWKVAKRGKILRMEVEESVLLPFNVAKVNAAVCQYTKDGSIQMVGDNVVDRVTRGIAASDVELRFALDRVSGGRELEGRSLLMRIRTAYGALLIWECMSHWQSTDASDKSPYAIVRESGWSIIAPANPHIEDLSIGYCGKSYRIQSSDGSNLKKSDPLVRKIVHTCQEFHNVHLRRGENIIMDRSLQQQRELSSSVINERSEVVRM